jgi:hypothetical protein
LFGFVRRGVAIQRVEVQQLIEPAWAKLKQFLRSLKARTAEALEQAVAQALSCITPDNARSWFRHRAELTIYRE